MCGRFSFLTDIEYFRYIYDAFGAIPPLEEWEDIIERKKSYNIAPSQEPLVLRTGDDGLSLAAVKWGFIPAWEKNGAKARKPINARAETVHSSGMFRSAFKSRRCLVPASGFYEWKRDGEQKQPYYITRVDGKPFLFAGIWERWQDQETFCIITTTPNEIMTPIHDRMPVVVEEENWGQWMDSTADGESIKRLLVPCESGIMKARPVHPAVNSPRNNDERCIQEAPVQDTFL